MNLRSFSGGNHTVLVELDMDFSSPTGMGGVDYPVLYWQTQLHFHPQRSPLPDYVFRSVEAQLELVRGPKIADSLPHPIQRIVRGHDTKPHNEYLNLQFPLDARQLAAIERHRQGGDLHLRLKVQLQVEEHGIADAHAETKRPQLFCLRALHRLALEEDVHIPQSAWISRVLPGLGYGKVHVLEFPAAPLDAFAVLDHSFKALQQAQEAHKQGRYDDAVGKCRVALDPFFEGEDRTGEDGKTRTVPVLKKSWETRVGESTLRWMNEAFGAMRAAANKPHHSPNSHFGPEESQLIFAVTSAMVAYAARCGGTEGKA